MEIDSLARNGVGGRTSREGDWSCTPLGPPSTWSPILRSTVRLVHDAPGPMFLSWGPDRIPIYNDAFAAKFVEHGGPRSSAGREPAGREPAGRESRAPERSETASRPSASTAPWPDMWSVIGPQLDEAMKRRLPCWREDVLLPITVDGRTREAYWTYALTPVIEEDGSVGGVLGMCIETTPRVFAERRGRTFRAFFDRVGKVTAPDEITPEALEVLATRRWDVAFATAYRLDGDDAFRPCATTLASSVDLPDLDKAMREHLATTKHSDEAVPLTCIDIDALALTGAFADAPVTRIALATVRTECGTPCEVIVYGLCPWVPWDESYRSHLCRFTEKISLTRGRIEALRAWASSECERRDLLLQSPLPTALMTGPDHVFELANPAFVELVGRDVVGEKYLEAFPFLADAELTKRLEHARRTGESFHLNEQNVPSLRTGELESRWVSFTVQPLRDLTGNVYGMMAVAVDITEIVKARRALEKLNSEREKLLDALEAANRSKDEFLAMLGHELRNPLAPIHTALHVMKRKDANALLREREIIERQASHLSHLVDDLLDVARVARGKVTLNTSRISLTEVIGHAVETASPLFEQKRHVLTVTAPDAGVDVLGDPLRLGQVFANLLTNAAKFTEPGGRIAIDVVQNGDFAVVRVEDNGSGIASEQLPRLFDTFFQGPRSRDRAQGGLGLGLALVRSLVSLHGGSVSARSEGLGRGSVFEVRLPALPATTKVETAPSGDETATSPSNGRRVLLVDDSEDILEIVSAMLRFEGYEVLAAHDGPTALQVAADFTPDIAILDIGLPAMDGYDLARHLREELGERTPKLVAMTGYGQAADSERARQAGFDVHLVKPVDPKRLLESLAL